MVASTNPYLNKDSVPSFFRRRRFKVVNELIQRQIEASGSCSVLDIGGTDYYWSLNSEFNDRYKGKLKIIKLNIGDSGDVKMGLDFIESRIGDATKMETYKDIDFDIIHSNSVIEHVGSWVAVKSMADCFMNSSKPFYVQTPNFWFPMEPHFRFLGWQWLPESWRAQLLMKKQRGFRGKARSFDAAMENVESVKLLTGYQLKMLFPGADIKREWVGPFVKSFMVVKYA